MMASFSYNNTFCNITWNQVQTTCLFSHWRNKTIIKLVLSQLSNYFWASKLMQCRHFNDLVIKKINRPDWSFSVKVKTWRKKPWSEKSTLDRDVQTGLEPSHHFKAHLWPWPKRWSETKGHAPSRSQPVMHYGTLKELKSSTANITLEFLWFSETHRHTTWDLPTTRVRGRGEGGREEQKSKLYMRKRSNILHGIATHNNKSQHENVY